MTMDLQAALQHAALGARVSTAGVERRAYARDLWPRGLVERQAGAAPTQGPAAVVWPERVEQVVSLVQFARSEGVCLVPFGAGSGVCGGVLPSTASVVVDLKRFAEFRVHEGPLLEVGAGALGVTLEERLLAAGYTTGHYPSSILCSTVGGWVAARGAGQCSGRYGKIEDMVSALEVVLGNGEVLHAESRCHGPELTPLLIGSEGTLGIITRVWLRLHPAARSRGFAAYSFEHVEAGLAALRALYQAGLRPAVARLYDPLDTWLMPSEQREHAHANGPKEVGLAAAALRAVLRVPALATGALAASERALSSRVALVLVHEGEASEVADEQARAMRLCEAERGVPLGEGPARAWYEQRYHVSYRQAPLFRSGCFSDTLEVSAPWSRLGAVYREVRAALGRHVLVMAHFSHAYPDGGSVYFTFAGTEHGDLSALEVYDRAYRVGLSAALGAGASLSHHHGIGRSKARYLDEAWGTSRSVLARIQRAWDPNGLLNPGVLSSPAAVEPAANASGGAHDAALSAPVHAGTLPALDSESALCTFSAALRVHEAESWLAARGRSLGLTAPAFERFRGHTLDAWVAEGLQGLPTRFEDPAGTRLSGFAARLGNGLRFELPAAPRRALGPDLSALFAGAGGRFGELERVTLPALPCGVMRAHPTRFIHSEPELNESEARAFEQLRAELAH